MFLTRTTTAERRAVGCLLDRAGLLLRPDPAGARDDPTALSRRFLAGGATLAIAGLPQRLAVEVRAVLVLAWGLGLARVAPGQALPRLEDLDADLPYMPPEGPVQSSGTINVEAILDEADVPVAASMEYP